MKPIKLKYIALCLSLFTLAGCDFMDCDESSDYSKQDIFESYARNKQMVTNVYGYLPHDFCGTENAMQDAATDDAIHIYESSHLQRMVNGTWSANYTVNDVWGKYYEGVRAANRYLKESEGQTFEEWKFADEYETIMKDFTNYQYEVRFLRAFFYFELAKRYQNVPLVKEVLTVEQANELKPETFAKVIAFVLSECKELAAKLPVSYSGFADKETGRITRGAALALKARAALYLASPLFTADNAEKWKAAASAAYEIIGEKAALKIQLDDKYADLFSDANNKSPEVILARPIGESGDFERDNFPMGVEGGRTSTCPTQNLMEAYEYADGTPFRWESLEGQTDPYVNRDPRMKQTLVCNDMAWPQKQKVEIWEGGLNGLPLTNATKTGYYLKKYVNKDISFASGSKVTKKHHNWVLFRYAEVLLNYAEAMVNGFHDPSYKDALYPMSALEAVNLVRGRADVKLPPLSASLSESEFMQRLKNERRVELAFEGHRFWDVRRWKELGKTANIYGVKVVKTAGGFAYTKFRYATRSISEKMYFYPISNIEKNKNPQLVQNQGW